MNRVSSPLFRREDLSLFSRKRSYSQISALLSVSPSYRTAGYLVVV